MFRHYALSPSALTRVSPSDHGGTTAALFDVACCFSAPCPCCRRHGPCELLSQSCSEIGSLHNLARFSAARSRRRARRTTVSTSEHFPGLGATVKDRGPVTIWWWYVYKYMYMCCKCMYIYYFPFLAELLSGFRSRSPISFRRGSRGDATPRRLRRLSV